MAAAKGTMPPNAGKGRRKGSVNKSSALIKDLVAQALEQKGGVSYLVEQAEKNPTSFLSLVGRLIPVQVGGDPDGQPIGIEHIRRTIVRS